MKGKRIPWSSKELRWVEAHKTMLRPDAHAAFCAKFGHKVTPGGYAALCKRKGWLTGRDGRIKPGNVPANKGKRMPFNANSAQTQFKKGGLPPNTKFLGHERVSKDGYVEISINRKNPHTGFERRYVLKHKYLWEKKERSPSTWHVPEMPGRQPHEYRPFELGAYPARSIAFHERPSRT